MFRGVNVLSLDAKGRLAMPTRYRESLAERSGGRLIITIDPDHCLLIYPESDWYEIERKLNRLPSFNKAARRMQRLLVGHATECELDGNGRILIPPPLRTYAKLDRRAVLIGQGQRFELWDEQRWNESREAWLTEDSYDDEHMPPELEQLSL